MASLGPASRRAWRELRCAGVPTFSAWAYQDARTPPPEPVVPADLPEERLPTALASLARHAAALHRLEARLLGDLISRQALPERVVRIKRRSR